MSRFVVLRSAIAVALFTEAALAAKCASVPKEIMLVNLKTQQLDGTAGAFIESGSCPVKINPRDALFEEANHHHQRYNLQLSDGNPCTINGWDNVATTMACTNAGTPDAIERKWADAGYKPQPCPPGCDTACAAIDPDWNTNAVKMFAFNWQVPSTTSCCPTKTGARPTVTATRTVTARPKKTRLVRKKQA